MNRCARKGAAVFLFMEVDMKWMQVPPESVEPDLFDLSEITFCMAAPYSGHDSLEMSKIGEWSTLVDIRTTCPCTGKSLPEATLYVFKVTGR